MSSGGGRRARTAIAAALALGALAGCAPRPGAPPPLEPGRREARFRAALEERMRRARAVEADLALWVLSADAGDLPGVEGRLTLAAPDAFRVRVRSLFGTALDLAAHGDSLVAYVPSRRLGVELDAARDSLAVRSPGGLGARLWGALWDPPPAAWNAASARGDSLLELRWREGADSLALDVGASGLPRRVRVARPEAGAVRVEYARWSRVSGVAWPAEVVVLDDDARLTVRCRISRVEFAARPDPERLEVRLPEGARRVDWPWLRARLARVLVAGTP